MKNEKDIQSEFHFERDAHCERLIKNARIMMVDDEPINMEVLQLHLESEGYNNFIASSDSTQAVELTRSSQPDVILLDLMMPQVSGFDILKALRQDEELWQTPVIVLTSSDDSATKLKALRYGANDFLSKPVDSSELALRLRNTLAAQAYQHRLAHFDNLTGLPNRKLFDKELKQVFKASGDRKTTALLLINLDRFKAINDSLGRKVGDEIIHSVARRLQQQFGDSDTSTNTGSSRADGCKVYRMGGDKFAVLVSGLLESRDAVVHALPFLKRMEEPFDLIGEEVFARCSIGISVFPDDAIDEEALLMHAETAMLNAKELRTNSYSFYASEMDAKALQLLGIENGMRSAIANNEFFLVYQPKVCIATGEIKSAEALVRWHHQELGKISPERFIPMAEDNGMIVRIGEWVLDNACAQAALWRKNINGDFKMSVNVSIRQVEEDAFISTVARILAVHDLPPEALTIELTENMIMENARRNVVKLEELKSLGVSISVDDFGTGYSSLSYLQKFPLDELKIDRSFIKTITSENDNAPIVRAVVSMAHELGLSVVAEGVETQEQLARVTSLKCEEFQGFLCSRPLPSEEFEQLLAGLEQRKAS